MTFDFADNVEELDLNNDEKNKFIEMCTNFTKKIFNSQRKFLDSIWLSLSEEYPAISKTAIFLLLSFSTSNLCKQAFSTLLFFNIKTSSKICLKNIIHDLHIAVSNFPLRIEELYKRHQSQISH